MKSGSGNEFRGGTQVSTSRRVLISLHLDLEKMRQPNLGPAGVVSGLGRGALRYVRSTRLPLFYLVVESHAMGRLGVPG